MLMRPSKAIAASRPLPQRPPSKQKNCRSFIQDTSCSDPSTSPQFNLIFPLHPPPQNTEKLIWWLWIASLRNTAISDAHTSSFRSQKSPPSYRGLKTLPDESQIYKNGSPRHSAVVILGMGGIEMVIQGWDALLTFCCNRQNHIFLRKSSCSKPV